ncbi:MAG: GNAT family N-acetyltransferase, partial [Pseudorhodoplanes sp.]|nr:GNAT family N-acetyltransferase [Pseudorhodoplanes sp.]
VRAACRDGLAEGNALVELHVLEGDGEMLALFSGIHDGRRFTSNFNSHTLTDHARFSPGLILMQHMIVNAADRGFQSFDVGPGAARYKSFFCKELEPLFDSVLPLSRRGRLVAWPLRLLLAAKSEIKRNPALWAVASRVRRWLRPTPPAES